LIGGHVKGPWATCDVPNRVPDQLGAAWGVPVVDASDFVTEGGDKSFNGHGTVLMSRVVERQRNPGKSDAEIERLARRYLHVRHVVWIDAGVSDDEQSFRGALRGEGGRPVYTSIGTGGHVDECARFVGARTVLLPQLTAAQAARSALAATTARRLEVNARLLANQTDQDGAPLVVERMPYPEELYLTNLNESDGVYELLSQLPELGLKRRRQRGESIDVVLAASYANYVIANGLVLLPQYHKPGRPQRFADADAAAVAAMQRVLPGHKIVGINPEPVNAGGGGLNCISNNMPAA